MSRLL